MTASSAFKDKIEIATYISGKRKWENFRPIVDFCLANECEISSRGTPEKPFTTDRGGVSRCNMYGPIAFDDILDTFALPDSFEVTVTERVSYITDPVNRTEFWFFSEEQKRQAEARRRTKIEQIKAQMKARKERLANLEGGA